MKKLENELYSAMEKIDIQIEVKNAIVNTAKRIIALAEIEDTEEKIAEQIVMLFEAAMEIGKHELTKTLFAKELNW